MSAMFYAGIAVAVYLGAPMILGVCIYCIGSCRKNIKIQGFPVMNTLVHIVVSTFLVLGFFINGMWSFIVFGILYVIKLIITCFMTKEMEYASNVRSEQSTEQFLQKMRQTKPELSIYIRCWHVEVYYTTEWHTDSHGHRHSHRERHEREVTTYTETRYVEITGWFDQTPPLVLPLAYRSSKVISLELNENYDYYENSESIVQAMKMDAYNQNRHRDAHCSATLHRKIPGLTPYNYLCVRLPLYMQMWCIMLAIMLMLDCPLVLITRARTPHCNLDVKKVVSLLPNRPAASPAQPAPPVSYPQPGQSDLAPPAMMPPENQPNVISPPLFTTNIDEIQPPIEIFQNTQPYFVERVEEICAPEETYTVNVAF